MKISILVNSKDRPQTLTRCLQSVFNQAYKPFEVLVLDDASSTCFLEQELTPRFENEQLRFLRVEESLGVARGRNLLMQQATGNLFVVIDDDAYFADDQALQRLVDVFRAQPDAGIVACKIIDHRAGKERLLIPFSQRARKQHPSIIEQFGRASYFLGGGHAVRRQVIDICGVYNNKLTFGEEELDLSYRAIEAGFEIYYLPDVIVHHYPQPSIIDADPQKQPELHYHVQNRFFLAYKYLPWRYAYIYLTIWLISYGLRALKTDAVYAYVTGVLCGFKELKTAQRNPLGSQSIAYLKANYGRLWY